MGHQIFVKLAQGRIGLGGGRGLEGVDHIQHFEFICASHGAIAAAWASVRNHEFLFFQRGHQRFQIRNRQTQMSADEFSGDRT